MQVMYGGPSHEGNVWRAQSCGQCLAGPVMRAMSGGPRHAGNVWRAQSCGQCLVGPAMRAQFGGQIQSSGDPRFRGKERAATVLVPQTYTPPITRRQMHGYSQWALGRCGLHLKSQDFTLPNTHSLLSTWPWLLRGFSLLPNSHWSCKRLSVL